MTCQTWSLPKSVSLLTTRPFTWRLRARAMDKCFRIRILTLCLGWDMEFNPSKYQVVRVTASRGPINTLCYLHGQVLEAVTSARYFGVDISSGLSWNSHIDRVTGNANSTLGSSRLGPNIRSELQRNIKTKLPKVRETAYNTLVRPKLEYASPIWDPHTKDKISQIEKVQRRAARWTTSNYDYRSSVTSMIENLGWRTLEQRRSDPPLMPVLPDRLWARGSSHPRLYPTQNLDF